MTVEDELAAVCADAVGRVADLPPLDAVIEDSGRQRLAAYYLYSALLAGLIGPDDPGQQRAVQVVRGEPLTSAVFDHRVEFWRVGHPANGVDAQPCELVLTRHRGLPPALQAPRPGRSGR